MYNKYAFYNILFIILFSFEGFSQGLIQRPRNTKQKNSQKIEFLIINSVSNPDGYASGHGYIDLGLPSGTRWAIENIGSETPYEFGSYVRWGSLQPKTSSKDNLNYDKRMKNVESSIAGNIKYDIATKTWGTEWCIPTSEQLQELVKECN